MGFFYLASRGFFATVGKITKLLRTYDRKSESGRF